MEIGFKAISKHYDISIEPKFYVSFSNFISCQAQNGGAIFSNSKIDHEIYFCFFISCLATLERAGAFFIKKGDISIKNVCCSNCDSIIGADILLWDESLNIEENYLINKVTCENIATHCCNAAQHSAYFSGTNIKIKDFNSTLHSIGTETNAYNNGIAIVSTTKFSGNFINVFNCEGGSGIIHFEKLIPGSDNLCYVNAINNKPYRSLFSSNFKEDYCLFVSNSKFIGNDFSSILWNTNGGSIPNIQFNFNSCSFSGVQLDSSESFSLCEFNVETISLNYTHNLDNCLIYFYKTNESHKFNIIQSFLLLFIFIAYNNK